ncbi:carbonic anhydrase [Vibrio sp. WJH972]
MKKLILAVSLTSLFNVAQASEWGYEGAHGPEHWDKVSQTCATGVNQSPINLNSITDAKLAPLDIQYTGSVTALMNNGHTLQATIEGSNTLSIDGREFELKQFHFHTPSENQINNKSYPLEGHFVHADKDGNLAVVAVMFDMGKKNEQLANLIQTLPKNGETVTLAESFDVKDMLPEYSSYYRFNGSLTTPPCSEGVRWFVLKNAKSLSDNQEQLMSGAMGKNNRPLQAINARVVLGSN